jgi:hypothetical protein
MNMEDVQRELKNKEKQYESIKELCESSIVNWKWATGIIFSVEPYFFERYQIKQGRLLKREPVRITNKVKIGFGINNNIVVSQEFTQLDGMFYENFYIYRNQEIIGYRFNYYADKELINIEYLRYRDNKIFEFSRLASL